MALQIKDFNDIHSHILLGLDDGAKDMVESLEIARCYQRTGIKTVVATPHFLPGTAWAAEKKIVKHSVQELQASLDRNNIELQVLPGMEIAFHKRLAERMRSNSFLSLGNSGYYLIESSFHGEQDSLLENLKSLLKIGQKLILAHPERIDRLHQTHCLHFIASDAHDPSERAPINAEEWSKLAALHEGEILSVCKGNMNKIFTLD